MTYEPKAGDRIRAEINVKSYCADFPLSFEIDLGTVELIKPAVTPGQRAYEAAAGVAPDLARLSWANLTDNNRANWETIAEAARTS